MNLTRSFQPTKRGEPLTGCPSIATVNCACSGDTRLPIALTNAKSSNGSQSKTTMRIRMGNPKLYLIHFAKTPPSYVAFRKREQNLTFWNVTWNWILLKHRSTSAMLSYLEECIPYHLVLPHALRSEYARVHVLHIEIVEQRHARFCPNPIDQRAQLE